MRSWSDAHGGGVGQRLVRSMIDVGGTANPFASGVDLMFDPRGRHLPCWRATAGTRSASRWQIPLTILLCRTPSRPWPKT